MSEAIVRAVVGLRGYGKTTRVLNLTRDLPRVLYYDTLGDDYRDGVICRDRKVFERFWLSVYRKRFRIVYRPIDPLADFPRVCELAYACGDMTLVVDEVQLYCHGQWCPGEFTKLITAGRHAGVNLVAVTQAPKKLGELLRSQAREWFIFATREPDHVHYLVDRCVGVDPLAIFDLKKYEYLHYVDGREWYTRCIDDLATGRTREERIDYETQAPVSSSRSDPGEHSPAERPLGPRSANGDSPVPAS